MFRIRCLLHGHFVETEERNFTKSRATMESVRERRYLLEGGWRVPLEGGRKGVIKTGDAVAPWRSYRQARAKRTRRPGKGRLQGA